MRNHPSDAALIKALELNDQRTKGLTRLDQQIVYVPLALMAGVVHDVLSTEKPLSAASARQESGTSSPWSPSLYSWR